MSDERTPHTPTLVRALGTWDTSLVTVGSVVGSAIFLAASDVARALPHPALILGAWLLGGLLTLAGGFSYGELGAMFPHAGGQYHYLKEAYGTFWGFLFGWTAFLVIMSGGLAALAAGFGEYVGVFLPFFATKNVIASASILGWQWTLNGGQVAGVLALVVLTVINVLGLRAGTGLQNVFTLVKIGSIVVLAALGLVLPAPEVPDFTAPLPLDNLLPALGIAMIAVLWSFDGWYGATALAGEMREPGRTLPRGILFGTLLIMALYGLMNLLYLRTLTPAAMGETARIGETAAGILLGPIGARLVSAAVLVSIFGCLASTVLYAGRYYLPMAQDGVFFRALAEIHPRFRTPAQCLVAQGVWSCLLTISGSYEQLYTYAIFAVFLFHAATGLAVFVLRRRRPDAERPYRAWGYPVVPLVFVLTSLAFVANTLVEKPLESAIGLGIVLLGVPAYLWWRRHAVRRETTVAP